MSSYLKKLLLVVLLVVTSKITIAQDVEMADAFRQDGKIYVVIAVVCILFAVIFGYLIYLDNKINKLKR